MLSPNWDHLQLHKGSVPIQVDIMQSKLRFVLLPDEELQCYQGLRFLNDTFSVICTTHVKGRWWNDWRLHLLNNSSIHSNAWLKFEAYAWVSISHRPTPIKATPTWIWNKFQTQRCECISAVLAAPVEYSALWCTPLLQEIKILIEPNCCSIWLCLDSNSWLFLAKAQAHFRIYNTLAEIETGWHVSVFHMTCLRQHYVLQVFSTTPKRLNYMTCWFMYALYAMVDASWSTRRQTKNTPITQRASREQMICHKKTSWDSFVWTSQYDPETTLAPK